MPIPKIVIDNKPRNPKSTNGKLHDSGAVGGKGEPAIPKIAIDNGCRNPKQINGKTTKEHGAAVDNGMM